MKPNTPKAPRSVVLARVILFGGGLLVLANTFNQLI